MAVLEFEVIILSEKEKAASHATLYVDRMKIYL
jgi:hypothetical protein